MIVTENVYPLVLQQSNTIILAVTAGNTDIANSDALKIARRVDPRGMHSSEAF